MLAIIWLDPATLKLHKLHSFMNIALSSYFKLWKLHTSSYFFLQFSYLFYLIVSSFYSLKTFDNRIEVILKLTCKKVKVSPCILFSLSINSEFSICILF